MHGTLQIAAAGRPHASCQYYHHYHYHYLFIPTKIKYKYVRLSVRLSVTEGQRKRFDLKPSYAISLVILWAPAMAQATGTNNGLLDERY